MMHYSQTLISVSMMHLGCLEVITTSPAVVVVIRIFGTCGGGRCCCCCEICRRLERVSVIIDVVYVDVIYGPIVNVIL